MTGTGGWIELPKVSPTESDGPPGEVISSSPSIFETDEPEPAPRLVEVTVDLPKPADWLGSLPLADSMMVRVLTCRPSGRGRMRMLRVFEIVAPPAKLNHFSEELGRHVPGSSLTLLPMGSNRLLVRLETSQTPVCTGCFRSGAFCLECPYFPTEPDRANGERRGSWILPSTGVTTLIRALRGPGPDGVPRLLRIGRYRDRDRLTSRQEEALRLAHRMGFFEVPRKADLGALSQALGVSRATAMELVRRGLRSLTARWSEGERDPASSAEGGRPPPPA